MRKGAVELLANVLDRLSRLDQPRDAQIWIRA